MVDTPLPQILLSFTQMRTIASFAANNWSTYLQFIFISLLLESCSFFGAWFLH